MKLPELPWDKNDYEALANKVSKEIITLGADPEFLILDKNGLTIPANAILPGDTRWFLGTDGHSATGEIRPLPSTDPIEVVASCGEAIKAMAPLMKGLRVIGGHGCGSETLGGHIHINLDRLTKGQTSTQVTYWSRNYRPILAHLNHTFKYLRRLLEENTQEDIDLIRNRVQRGYGVFNSTAMRTQDHGGMEYRPPPSWLSNPTVATFYMVCAQVAAYDAMMSLEVALTKMTMCQVVENQACASLLKKNHKAKLYALFQEGGLPHYPECLRLRMQQVAHVIRSEVDWRANILETWEVI